MTEKKRGPPITLHAACSPGEVRVAALAGDELTDYAIWREGAPDGLGDLHLGRVVARVPAMAGAFVLIDGAEGFLPDSEGGEGRHEGDILPVRVSRSAQGGKGPRLTARIAGESSHTTGDAPRLLRRGPGALVRLAERFPGAEILIDDAATAARLRAVFAGRARVVPKAFDDELESEIEALGSRHATLPDGLSATIVPTPALVAIDIDSGAATAARGTKGELQFAANRAALPALARQIRLRNLSGAILIDFAGLRRPQASGARPPTSPRPSHPIPQAPASPASPVWVLPKSSASAATHRCTNSCKARTPPASRPCAMPPPAWPKAPPPACAFTHTPPSSPPCRPTPRLWQTLHAASTHTLMLRSDPSLRPLQWMLDNADPT